MFRHTGFAAIAAAAVLLSACDRKSDGPTAPAVIATPVTPAQTRATISGIVKNVMNDDSTTTVKLTTSDGLVFTLTGPIAPAVGGDEGLQVRVSGELNSDQFQLYVESFEIVSTESSTCQNLLIVDMPPDCLSQIEKLNPHRAHLGNQVRPR
jgi:hypothetical protein